MVLSSNTKRKVKANEEYYDEGCCGYGKEMG